MEPIIDIFLFFNSKSCKLTICLFGPAYTFVGAVMAPSEIWTLADFSIGSMTLINVFVLCIGATQVKVYTDKVFKRKEELTE